MSNRRRRQQTPDAEDVEESMHRHQRRRNDSASEDDEANEANDTTMDLDPRGGGGIESQLALKLVRYALSCEFSRTPIRRQGIREKVLGDHPRTFRRVFAEAQGHLKRTFGMEMRQLPVREKLTLEEKRKALNSNSQAKAAETWILVSILPKPYQNPVILAPSNAPTAEYEATYVGFYTMVIALIALNGGEITEQKLKRHLSRLNADSKLGADKTEEVLAKMERSAYVVKRVENISPDQDKNISWLVGPRGKEEIGPEGVAGVVREVFGGSTPELERRLAGSLGIAPQEAHEEALEDGGEEGDGEEDPRNVESETRRSSRRAARG
ncbi:uncharacterized protein DNG_06543 [Cephalotrichum gorgonifer]|uniref:MAGE domain-containing protein n=1 Tax=Cephalotrichum gorgonifer TaxID=2041049 RepID=A0AAE8N038_9PEZI|nr:uncharacterized protein DNG_06543 [Cephalotrichum gorgonifer]